MQIEFGCHKGKELSEIPSSYLRWLVNDYDPTPRPGELRGMPRDYGKFLLEQRRELVSAAEDELIERGEA